MVNTDIFELINDHKKSISHSFLFYRYGAKLQKLNVLVAATNYLSGKLSKENFIKTIDKNPKYVDALGVSKTKLLIDAALNESPSLNRTKEGYIMII